MKYRLLKVIFFASGGRRKDTPEIEFPKSRSTASGPRPPVDEVTGLSGHLAAAPTAASPSTYGCDDEDGFYRHVSAYLTIIRRLRPLNTLFSLWSIGASK